MSVVLGWQAQVVVFVVLAVAAVLLGRRFYGRAGTDADGLANDRSARQVGRTAVLDTAITEGTGHIRLDDTIWRAEGPDLPAGARVRIAGYRNGRFQVVAAD
jgi:inner membrane protein